MTKRRKQMLFVVSLSDFLQGGKSLMQTKVIWMTQWMCIFLLNCITDFSEGLNALMSALTAGLKCVDMYLLDKNNVMNVWYKFNLCWLKGYNDYLGLSSRLKVLAYLRENMFYM